MALSGYFFLLQHSDSPTNRPFYWISVVVCFFWGLLLLHSVLIDVIFWLLLHDELRRKQTRCSSYRWKEGEKPAMWWMLKCSRGECCTLCLRATCRSEIVEGCAPWSDSIIPEKQSKDTVDGTAHRKVSNVLYDLTTRPTDYISLACVDDFIRQ